MGKIVTKYSWTLCLVPALLFSLFVLNTQIVTREHAWVMISVTCLWLVIVCISAVVALCKKDNIAGFKRGDKISVGGRSCYVVGVEKQSLIVKESEDN